MKKLVFYSLLFLSVNAYAWNPFDDSKKLKDMPITSSERSTLKLELKAGQGNNLNVKVYNGLAGTVYCTGFVFYESNDSYTVSNPVTFFPQSINSFTVKAFDLNKVKSGNLADCRCEKINNGKGVCS